ncbi:alcohol dehydrogenase catalytic domain-containing protein [Rhizobium sp. KVB221]|uniref:Alcohol dehydrogenase catalytic domain-containing protein n=1 Tax=Rhizobium setariae TaxID=2801340 RepID=A0A936YR44_9HYPH|nr:alcohol dehydrogenase catalytic domain-containing protein [Rhizobium setariae]MBL0375178.1 alcohol dehydrogenase catalytic domain-containing protein [Rhizobium setariae]
METMKAAVLVAPHRFEIREMPVPAVGPADVLIKVARTGICGTDMHMFNGHYAADQLPIIPGHEFSGTIARLGADVTRLNVGMRVVADINVGCGTCFYCRRNEILNCAEVRQIGISRDGGFAEYVSVSARLVIPAAAEAEFDLLALVEPVACVVRAARKANVRFGQSVVILGAGPIGNLHVQMMRVAGAAPIIVVEPSEHRAQLARQAGADVVITDPENARQTVLAMTDGRGADVVIESVGLPKLYRQALGLLRPGGHLAAFGITGDEETLPLPLLDTVLREYSLKGSVAGMGEDMHDALTLLTHGRFKLDAFRGASYRLDDIQQAFEDLPKRTDALKIQIEIS